MKEKNKSKLSELVPYIFQLMLVFEKEASINWDFTFRSSYTSLVNKAKDIFLTFSSFNVLPCKLTNGRIDGSLPLSFVLPFLASLYSIYISFFPCVHNIFSFSNILVCMRKDFLDPLHACKMKTKTVYGLLICSPLPIIILFVDL